MSLPAMLRAEKQQILSSWEAIVSSLAGARQLSHPALRNHVPVFFDWLVEQVERHGEGEDFPHARAMEHANERVSAGYDLSEVISEYAVLRDCIYEAWERNPGEANNPVEWRILNRALDEAISFTSVFYARMRLFREGASTESEPLVTPH